MERVKDVDDLNARYRTDHGVQALIESFREIRCSRNDKPGWYIGVGRGYRGIDNLDRWCESQIRCVDHHEMGRARTGQVTDFSGN